MTVLEYEKLQDELSELMETNVMKRKGLALNGNFEDGYRQGVLACKSAVSSGHNPKFEWVRKEWNRR